LFYILLVVIFANYLAGGYVGKIVYKKIESDTSLQNKAMIAKRKEYKLEINDKDMKKSYNKTVENIEKSSNK